MSLKLARALGSVLLVGLSGLNVPQSSAYTGQEPNAPWRIDAAQRIDLHRKADLTVIVQNQWGDPMPNIPVEVRMRRHAFPFGSAVGTSQILSSSPDARRYQEIVTNAFNRVVIENNLKWPYFENSRQTAIDAVDWLYDRGLEIRGHNIIWPSWDNCPPDVESLQDRTRALRARIYSHITDVTTTFAGKLVDWDVINEPYSEHDLMDVLGDLDMVTWFQRAKQGDPDAVLYLNDYNIITSNGTHSAHQNHYFQTIEFLLENGAPIEGIGMQGHFGGVLPPPETLYAILERFSVFNLPIQITEFDIDVETRELQSDYLHDFYTMVFSHPLVEGIMMWGFWEGRHWRPNAALYNVDWTLREHGQRWYDLVFGEWWTDSSGTTDSTGQFRIRGFKGDYEIDAAFSGLKTVQSAKLINDEVIIFSVTDPAPRLLSGESSMQQDGQFRLRIGKGADTSVTVYASTNLTTWMSVYTNNAPVTVFDYTDPNSFEQGSRYYKAEANSQDISN